MQLLFPVQSSRSINATGGTSCESYWMLEQAGLGRTGQGKVGQNKPRQGRAGPNRKEHSWLGLEGVDKGRTGRKK